MRLREAILSVEEHVAFGEKVGALKVSSPVEAQRVLLAAARKWQKARKLLASRPPTWGAWLKWGGDVDALLKGRP